MARAPFFRYAAGWITLLVWALAAGSALYWVLHARGDTPALLPAPPLAEAPAVSVQAVAHALGAPNASAQVAAVTQEGLGSRVRLLGVVTQGAEDGAALLVVDGKPPRP
ncbi:MAG: general secretion pathway protein C, partial [Burkholderiaceae bacterium]|nr:general secretion pathway protein C [Burkholderiaceae bacterium]